VRAAVEQFGRLDAVVSNAGIFDTMPFDEIPPDDWRKMLTVHLDGSFYVSQAAYRVMKANGGGRFVFIASSAGLFGQPNSAHYAAAKAGIIGLANVIAIDGSTHGILANAVLPFGYSRMVSETMGDIGGEVPFVAAIQPDLVVPMVVFLASRSCSFTHRIFSACAGRFARVFIGLGEGWIAPAGTPTAEDIDANLADISATRPFSVPSSIFDEVEETCRRLGIPM
jgi:NAD(P)-dependent dehydrogenase (short-subunit alcohol dehydrogenase family)